MNISKIGGHPLPVGPEIETTATKPPSPGTPRETAGSGDLEQGSGAHQPASINLPKHPLDDAAAKALLSEKLNSGNGGYSGPQTRMRDDQVDTKGWGDDAGTDPGPDPGDASTKDSGAGDVGIGLSHRDRLDGDGHTKSTQGGSSKTGGTTNNTQSGGNTAEDLGIRRPELRPIMQKKIS